MERDEQKLRQVIRKFLKEYTMLENSLLLKEGKESVADTASPSTGINVLEDLLKKIIPSLEKDYKVMTSSQKQRQSFRAHIVNAISRTLKTISVNSGALLDAPPGSQINEVEISMPDAPPRDKKFIDIQKAKKPTEDDLRQQFSLPGQDETGRNLAMESFSKMEKQITDAYTLLGDDEDRKVFRDYLLTNIKLYFDKFEDELQPNLKEPTTPEYEQEKQQKSADVSFSL